MNAAGTRPRKEQREYREANIEGVRKTAVITKASFTCRKER